jgi:hypothetical protein
MTTDDRQLTKPAKGDARRFLVDQLNARFAPARLPMRLMAAALVLFPVVLVIEVVTGPFADESTLIGMRKCDAQQDYRCW